MWYSRAHHLTRLSNSSAVCTILGCCTYFSVDCSTSSEVNDKASLCLNIYGDQNLNSWFEDKLPDRLKLDLLKKAARLTVVNSQAKAINLPGLKQAEGEDSFPLLI